MGKASSAKKVARAARSAGKVRAPRQRGMVFPVALGTVLVLGTGLVFYGESRHDEQIDNTFPAIGDHIHVAYGIYACDSFIDPVSDQTDPLGIHTHGDGVIHVHPVSSAASGKKAQLGVFFDAFGGEVSDEKLDVPGAGTWEEGDDCAGRSSDIKVAVWDSPTDETATVYSERVEDIHFDADRQIMTIGFVPDDVDLPKPPSVPTLDNLSDVGGDPDAGIEDQLNASGEPTASSIVVTAAPGDTTATTVAPTATTAAPASSAPPTT